MSLGEGWPGTAAGGAGCALHGVPYGQFCYTCSSAAQPVATYRYEFASPAVYGWRCPGCLRVHSPLTATCMFCPAQAPAVPDAIDPVVDNPPPGTGFWPCGCPVEGAKAEARFAPGSCPHGFPPTVRCHQCSPVTAPAATGDSDGTRL